MLPLDPGDHSLQSGSSIPGFEGVPHFSKAVIFKERDAGGENLESKSKRGFRISASSRVSSSQPAFLARFGAAGSGS